MSMGWEHDEVPVPRGCVRIFVTDEPGDVARVRLVGEADALAAQRLRRDLAALLRTCPMSVVVDLVDVTFCDLAGASAIDRSVQQAERDGRRVEVRDASALVSWLLRTSREVGAAHQVAVSLDLADHEA
ncbi:STAS domain-containing protein [Cellulomonas rhizosphaerae]|nr:STAS domain-containing protein [Cellulomonas rhizosphaerae]